MDFELHYFCLCPNQGMSDSFKRKNQIVIYISAFAQFYRVFSSPAILWIWGYVHFHLKTLARNKSKLCSKKDKGKGRVKTKISSEWQKLEFISTPMLFIDHDCIPIPFCSKYLKQDWSTNIVRDQRSNCKRLSLLFKLPCRICFLMLFTLQKDVFSVGESDLLLPIRCSTFVTEHVQRPIKRSVWLMLSWEKVCPDNTIRAMIS